MLARRLILPALALLLAACASNGTPPMADAPTSTAPTNTATAADASPTAAATDDPYVWLEELRSERAMAWVNGQNTRTLSDLEADPRFAGFRRDAEAILAATDRIAYPALVGREVHNFWQDPTHVRGLWRRTTRESYASDSPQWEVLLDVDDLARRENANWVYEGADCRHPAYRRCLVQLSNGGEDAVVVREFDTTTRAFVEGGFNLPSGKQWMTWLDDDTLLVAREWGPGTMTASSYPFVIRELRRGQPLTEAREVFRGQASDVGVSPSLMTDGDGREIVLLERSITFFEAEHYILTGRTVTLLPLPRKSTIQGYVNGQVLATLEEPWTYRGTTYPQGALVALRGVQSAGFDPAALEVSLLVAPTARQSIEQVAVTAHTVLAAVYDNVRGSIQRFTWENGAWRSSTVLAPTALSVGITSASNVDETYFYNVAGYLNPSRLWQADARTDAPGRVVKSLPSRFNAEGLVVEQFEATSTDGARIPYFVVHRRDMPLDGSNPTLLYAYGGFQSSELPTYSGTVGRLWLERGGVFVVANIRGGGEFGPAWHQAGLRTRRQIVFDDFTAVARDLIARRITSPRRLGIQGGSNGGLLMGVQFNQHPDLYRAVVIQVPLLDMIRYTQIGAGASWVDEYGDPANPQEGAFLRSISPYHNVRRGVDYPVPFFVTSTNDDRVTPVHARKMAARMEELGLPFLYYENTQGGHAASANLQERARRVALEFTYLSRTLMD